MLKVILVSMLVTSVSMATEKPCNEFARGAGEATYLTQATGIQGHEYESSVVAYKANAKNKTADITVEVAGSNDEGDSWNTKFVVTVNTAYCQVVEVNEQK